MTLGRESLHGIKKIEAGLVLHIMGHHFSPELQALDDYLREKSTPMLLMLAIFGFLLSVADP